MSPTILKVNGHSDRWLAQGFPWVYPGEVVGPPPRRGGAELLVMGPTGVVRGRALGDSGWIAARLMRRDDGPLDATWLRQVLERARARRPASLFPDTDAIRLVHGENDDLPGIRVDAWGNHRVLTLDSPSLAPLLSTLVEVLTEGGGVRAVWLCYRPDSRDTLDEATFLPRPGLLWGEGEPIEVVVRECGMRLRVRPWEGPDVGSYADMREVRRWLAPTWSGRTVLNTFAYTGAFSVAAALGGARRVVSVDLARPCLARAEANFIENGLDTSAHGFEVEDTFKALDRWRRQGTRFDTVIVDPPSFSRSGNEVWSAVQHMPRLVAAAAHVVDGAGWLVVASNQGKVSPHQLRGQVAQGLDKAGRTGVELALFGAAPDFPASVTFPEGHYLKVGVWALDAPPPRPR